MATGAEAIESVAAVTGISPTTVNRAARILRESGMDLWPQAAPGGGKNAAHTWNRHLISLSLSFGADPITSAPDLVLGMRGLVPVTMGQSVPFLPGADLGQALDAYLDVIATVEGRASMADRVQHLTVAIRRFGTRRPVVTLKAYGRDAKGRALEYLCLYDPPASEMEAAVSPIPGGAPMTKLTLNNTLFETLAYLWADTKARGVRVSTSSSPGLPLAGGTPGTKNAALAGAARMRIQDRDLAAPEGDTPEYKRESENAQALQSRGPGPSPSRYRKDSRYVSATDAAARTGG